MVFRRRCRVVVLAGLMMLATSNAQADDRRCETVRLPVALTESSPVHQESVGRLCRPSAASPRSSVVQLLIHGGTYGKDYWDWPQSPRQYSYVRAALHAGFATLAVDRLGVGETSRPPSIAVNFPTNTHVLHQWVQALRGGTVAGSPFTKVVLVGHSFGSGYAVDEAATYGDVDAVLLSGFLHASGLGVAAAVQSLWPAAIDPRFAGRIVDPGYVTTRLGQRGVFYWAPGADPAVIARDEALKQPMASTEFPGLFSQILGPPLGNKSISIRVPVLLAVGDHDALFCGLQVSCTQRRQIAYHEAPFFPNAPRVDVKLLANQGHDLNLHRAAPAFFHAAQRWIAAVTK